MPIPQAPRWEDPQEIKSLISKYRQRTGDAASSDYEVAVKMEMTSSRFQGLSRSETGDEFYKEHLRINRPGFHDLKYGEHSAVPRWDLEAPVAPKRDKTWAGEAMGLGGAVEALPDWLSNAIKQGANESITGIAVAIADGDTPFNIDEDYDPNMVESALAFGTGLLYDSWFFLATRGLGLGASLAGATARKAAGEMVAKQLFAQRIGSKELATQLGIKNLGRGIPKAKWVKDAVKGTKDVPSAVKALQKAAKKKDIILNKEILESTVEESIKGAKQMLPDLLANPEFLAKGLTKGIEGEALGAASINAPSLARMFNHFGSRGAIALGMYETTAETGRQWRQAVMNRINPETGQPYTYGEATDIIDRLKEVDNEDFNPDIVWDLEQIGWRALHGAAGGYMAAGVGGIMQAGKVGAFKGKGGIGDKLEKQIGDWTYGKAMELNLEAGGFTGTSAMLNFMETGSIDGGTGEGLGGMFVHNLVTVGVLKGMKWMEKPVFDKAGEAVEYGVKKYTQRKIKQIRKLVAKLEGATDEASKKIRKQLEAEIRELDSEANIKIEGFKERITRINEILEGKGLGVNNKGKLVVSRKQGTRKQYKDKDGSFQVANLTAKDARELISIVRELKEYKDKIIKEGDLPADEIKALFGEGKDNIWTQIEEQLNGRDTFGRKFLESLDKAEARLAKLKAEGQLEGVDTKEIEKGVLSEKEQIKYDSDREHLFNRFEQEGITVVKDKNNKNIPLDKATNEQLQSRLDALDKARLGPSATNRQNAERVKDYEDMPESSKKLQFGEKIANKITQTINNSKGTLKNVYSRLVTIAMDGTGAKKIETQMTMARKFDAWLKKNGVEDGLEKAEVGLMNQFLNSEYANPGGTGSPQFYAKFIMAAIKGGEYSKYKLDHKATKSKRNPLFPEEYADAQMEFREAVQGQKGELKIGGKSISYNLAHAVNFIVGKLGSRSDFIFGGENSKKLKVSDIKEGNKFGNRKTLNITFRGKTGEIVWKVLDAKSGKEGINYYKVFKELSKGKEQKDFLFSNVDGSNFTKTQYNKFANQFLIGGKEGATPHTLRNTLISIGKKLDAKGTKVPKKLAQLFGESWSDIADGIFLTHKGETSMKERYGKFYENAEPILIAKMEIYHEFHKAAEKGINETPAQRAARLKEMETTIKSIEAESGSKKQISLELEETKSLSEIKKEVDASKREGLAKKTLEVMDNLERWELERAKMKNTGTDAYEMITRKIETAKKVLAVRLAKSQLEVRNPLHAKALDRIITLLASRNKGLETYIKKHGKEAGEFIDDMIKVTEGKADATTFFHENVHRLEKFINHIGDKKLSRLWKQAESDVIRYAKKHHKKLYEQYDKGYGFDKEGNRLPNAEKVIANELMTQLAAESSLRQFSREGTWLGRSRNLINRLVSQLRTSLGFGSMKDVARLYGDIARRGFSTEGMKLSIGQKKYQVFNSGEKPSRKQESEYAKVHAEKQLDAAMMKIIMSNSKGLWDVANDVPAGNMRIGKDGKVTGADARQLELLTDIIKVQVDTHTYDAKTSKSRVALLNQTYVIRKMYGITTHNSRAIAKELGVPGNGSIRNASDVQLGRLQEFYAQFGKKTPPNESVLNEAMIDKVAEKSAEFGEIRKAVENMTMSVSYVLKKMGFKKLSHKIADHYLDEASLVGIGASAVHEAQQVLGAFSKNPATKLRAGKEMDYIPYAIDKSLLEPTELADGRIIQPKENPKRDAWLREAEIDGTKQQKAVKIIEDMFDRYWDEFLLRGDMNIKNPAVFESFLKEYNNKYIQGYFTRVLTKEAAKHLKYGAGKEQSVENLMKKNLKQELDKMEKDNVKVEEIEAIEKGMENQDSDIYLNRKKEAEHQLLMMIAPQPTKITNKNLLERSPRLDNTLVTESGKEIQTYETSFEKVVGKYQRNMSNFLATMKHMPEFTDMRSYMNFSGVSGDVLEAMRTGSDLGAYVDTIIRRRIGMNTTNQVNKVWTDVLTYMGKGSALFGLSSPFSGIKNLVIGTQMTIGVHGFHAFKHGLQQTFNPLKWNEARRKGWLQLGTKELELKGVGEFWMKNISRMTGTEAINRVIGGFAGEFNARQMVAKLRGHNSMYPNKAEAKIQKELHKMFDLKSEEIAFIQRYGLDSKGIEDMGIKGKRFDLYSATQQQILNKIQHYGHIKSQGASGDPFLPLWAGHPNAKAMTLFYRMAYSGTSNVWNHIIRPAKDGNFLPMARYGFASNVGGAALWGVYESVLGQKPPKMNEGQLAVIGQNMAKAEALGLYSFLLNPYSGGKGLKEALISDSIMQPAIIRNTFNLGEFLSKAMSPQEADMVGAGRDLLNDSFVAAGHLKKFWSRRETPFKTDIRNIRTFRSQFEKTSGLWEEYNKGNPFSKKHNVNSEYYTLIKDAFSGTAKDMEAAARYYVATWYYLYDSKRVFNGAEAMRHKETKQYVDSALNNVVKKINPMYVENLQNTGKLYSTRQKFLQYLKPEERAKALQVEKQYYHKLRQLNKLLRAEFDKQGGYYSRGKMIDMFPSANVGPNAKLRSSDLKQLMNI